MPKIKAVIWCSLPPTTKEIMLKNKIVASGAKSFKENSSPGELEHG